MDEAATEECPSLLARQQNSEPFGDHIQLSGSTVFQLLTTTFFISLFTLVNKCPDSFTVQ